MRKAIAGLLMVVCVAVSGAGVKEATYYQRGGLSLIVPLAAMSLVGVYEGEAMFGFATDLARYKSFAMTATAAGGANADALIGATVDWNCGELVTKQGAFVCNTALFVGHNFYNGDNVAGVKLVLPIE